MMKIFTQNDLVRALYNETSTAEERELETALLCDGNLYEEYVDLKSTKNELDLLLDQPSDAVINRVLDYSMRLSALSN